MIAVDPLTDPSLWPHQRRGLLEWDADLLAGYKRLCLVAPTGAGKTRMMIARTKHNVLRGKRTIILTDRKMLRSQLSEELDKNGIAHGVMASGVVGRWFEPVQICMVGTLDVRVFRQGRWDLPPADEVFVDEIHKNCSFDPKTGEAGAALELQRRYIAAGATVSGFSATPLGIDHAVDKLIIVAKNSELRECGSHVVCHTFAPDEPDSRRLKSRQKTGEEIVRDRNTGEEIIKPIMTPAIIARVYDWYHKLNPDGRPCLGFAPGVKESIWLCEEGAKRGIRCAHIDGEHVWLDGRLYGGKKADELRDRVREMSRTGEVKVVWNRFVMREGIDWPWLYHCIMATVFSELQPYLQAGGRLVRAFPGLDHVILQDHGGNFWRHGSLNLDREWKLGDTSKTITDYRAELMREGEKQEPITCPACAFVRSSGNACPACDHTTTKRSRMVIQENGELVEMTGKRLPKRHRKMKPDTEAIWERIYHRMRRAKKPKSWKQAEALFFRENGYYPPRGLKFMPKDSYDWLRRVKDVPVSSLN